MEYLGKLEDNQRICPSCKNVMSYSSKYKKQRADKSQSVCKTCCGKARAGELHPMFGKQSAFKGRHHTDEAKKILSEKSSINNKGENNPMFGSKGGMFGKKHSAETRLKLSENLKGRIFPEEWKKAISKGKIEYYKTNENSRKGTKHTEEVRNKMRLAAIKRIEKSKFEGHQFYPSYNKKSIPIIDEYCLLNNLTIQHAENLGEFFIKDLGFWVDGYDSKNNVVIEYYEKHHKYTEEKDTIRMLLIMNYLKCDFHILHENGHIEINRYDKVKTKD